LSNNNLPKGVGRTFESCWAGQISYDRIMD